MVDTIGRAKIIVETVIDKSSLDTSSGKIGSKLKVGAAVGVAAFGTLAVAGVKAFKTFEDAESVSNKLANTLGNMGKSGAVDELEKLASTLQRQTGISDETIKSGQTLLATFDAVAVSAGEIGGTFDRATRVAVDMSSVFGSVESASRTLGKALSDPEKAAALLRRSNVILTEEQQKLLDAFNKTGDAAGAQNLILSVLEERYKGTAEAGATESQKISEAMGEIEEAAGKALAALLGGGEGKTSLSAELFKVSDAISEMAESDDWQNAGKDIRSTASDLRKIGAAMLYIRGEGDKLTSKWGGWGDAIEGTLNPAGKLVEKLGNLLDVIRRLNDEPNPITDYERQLGADDVEELLLNGGLGSAGGGRIGSGLRLVGENGPEIISMGSGGGYVHNNSETRGMLAGVSTAQRVTHLHFHGPENLAEARRREDWSAKYGTRFGAATNAGAM